MTLHTPSSSPVAKDWGHVAVEAVKHPWESGLVDFAVGGAGIGMGASCGNVPQVALGTALVGFGANRARRFVHNHGTPKPVYVLH